MISEYQEFVGHEPPGQVVRQGRWFVSSGVAMSNTKSIGVLRAAHRAQYVQIRQEAVDATRSGEREAYIHGTYEPGNVIFVPDPDDHESGLIELGDRRVRVELHYINPSIHAVYYRVTLA